MPMDRKRYPRNWDEIASGVKQAANWTCQQCGTQCVRPGMLLPLTRSQRARLTLTVHHRDFTPENNHPNNLVALCAPCHLSKHSGRRSNSSPGQLTMNLEVS